MNFIKNIINKLKQKNIPTPLGRWKIETCNTKMSNKIDLSNEDHCGPCGQYSLKKLKNYENKRKYNDEIDVNHNFPKENIK